MSGERRCRRFSCLPSQREGWKRGARKARGEQNVRQDQKSERSGWAGRRRSMLDGVCVGVQGRLTSGLHYRRKAQWGSADLSSKYKGVVVAPAREQVIQNKWRYSRV